MSPEHAGVASRSDDPTALLQLADLYSGDDSRLTKRGEDGSGSKQQEDASHVALSGKGWCASLDMRRSV
jgi:hypothetical protein